MRPKEIKKEDVLLSIFIFRRFGMRKKKKKGFEDHEIEGVGRKKKIPFIANTRLTPYYDNINVNGF